MRLRSLIRVFVTTMSIASITGMPITGLAFAQQVSKNDSCATSASCQPVKSKTMTKIDPPSAPLPPGVKVIRDIPYGTDLKQQFDVYLPAAKARKTATAPILIMVHGGAWLFGDRTSPGVVGNKAAHWLNKGYVFISVDNRLAPQADPMTQAMDVAAAIAKIEETSSSWRADATRIVLMGHSAGGHLVSLLSADPSLAAMAGAKPWRGTVVLDSGALNVPAIMQKPHADFFDKAFGANADYWREVSPLDRLSRPLPMLMICSLRRADSCGPAQVFVDKAVNLGGKATILREDLSHEEINGDLGLPGAYTKAVEAFMHSIGLP